MCVCQCVCVCVCVCVCSYKHRLYITLVHIIVYDECECVHILT